MAEMLLINPRKRRKAAKKAKRRVRRSNPVSYRAVTRRAKVASNPRRRSRRRNPIARAMRRRRNPIAVRGIIGSIVPMLMDAAVGAAGAIAVDAVMGQVNKYLPTSMQPTPGAVGTNDAIKMVTTITLGHALSRPTRGLSRKAAAGALTVQMDKAIRSFLPAAVKSQLAYGTVAPVVPGRMTVAPNAQRMNAYTPPGAATPLLNAYTPPRAASPLLNGRSYGNARVGSGVR